MRRELFVDAEGILRLTPMLRYARRASGLVWAGERRSGVRGANLEMHRGRRTCGGGRRPQATLARRGSRRAV